MHYQIARGGCIAVSYQRTSVGLYQYCTKVVLQYALVSSPSSCCYSWFVAIYTVISPILIRFISTAGSNWLRCSVLPQLCGQLNTRVCLSAINVTPSYLWYYYSPRTLWLSFASQIIRITGLWQRPHYTTLYCMTIRTDIYENDLIKADMWQWDDYRNINVTPSHNTRLSQALHLRLSV